MCGIAGYVQHDLSRATFADQDVLRRMTLSLIHRGPDSWGYFYRPPVALGHRRLSIIDLEHGAQPMSIDELGLTISYNGEIYNYRELNRELKALGFEARTRSDTETVLLAYAAWGEECVKKFNGMFAFVIYDERKRRLFGARDRMGQKPLYYVHNDSAFAFASEAKALLQHPAVSREVDPQAAALYLVYENVPAPFAIYRGMRKLEAGHSFAYELDRDRLKIDSYWDLPRDEVDHSRSESSWIEEIRAKLAASVERRLLADVPVGVLLSGGIDSCAIVAALVKLLGHRDVRTFTLGFSDKRFDETGRARQFAQQLGTVHKEMTLDPAKLLDVLPRVAAGLDEPFSDSSILPTSVLARFVREDIRVSLSGDGGDELFAGYQTFRALPFTRAYNALVPAVINKYAVKPLANRVPVNHTYFSFHFKLNRFLRGMKAPEEQRLWRWLGAFVPEQLQNLLSPAMLSTVDLGSLYVQVADLHKRVDTLDSVARDGYVFAKTYLADDILTKVDRATMASSLEARCPLLDVEFVELASRIPSRLKARGPNGKYIFKKALEGLVPSELLNGPKQGFGLPVGPWIRGALREQFLDTLSEKRMREEGMFCPQTVSVLIDDHMSGRRDNRKPLWALFMFELWRENWLKPSKPPLQNMTSSAVAIT